MSPPTDRKNILQNLRSQINNGKIIVGAGAGIGLSAKFIEAGGGDLIIIYNSGRYRMAGRGSLAGLMPYGNANDVVLEMVCKHRLMQKTNSSQKGSAANNLRLAKFFLS
jgi:predicted TIM-barrel enzyme